MDSLEFEFVSLSEAKAAAAQAATKIAVNGEAKKSEVEQDWVSKRQQQISFDLELQPETQQWLDDFPEEVRPVNLARQFARVANKIARAWRRPAICDGVFEELLIDHRGTRQGFPEEVAMEISALAEYYRTVAYPKKSDVWTLR